MNIDTLTFPATLSGSTERKIWAMGEYMKALSGDSIDTQTGADINWMIGLIKRGEGTLAELDAFLANGTITLEEYNAVLAGLGEPQTAEEVGISRGGAYYGHGGLGGLTPSAN